MFRYRQTLVRSLQGVKAGAMLSLNQRPWRELLLEILLLVVFLILSAAFSGTETAYFFLDDKDRAALAAAPGREGKDVVDLLRDPTRLLAALLIGNLLVNISASVLATSALVRWFGSAGVAVAVPVMTIVLLFAGEITPKLIALRSPPRIALAVRPALRVWLWIIRPLLSLVAASSEALMKILPAHGRSSGSLSQQALIDAAGLAVSDASLTETEGLFLSRLVMLEQLEVREIMTPRPAVTSLSPGLDRDAVLELARRAGYNRYPVMDEEDARPRGVVHLKDLLGRDDRNPLAHDLRDPTYVPETKSVASLLREMKVGTSHMALVVDEHGDYVGLVTLEDCLEVFTGPWSDETDRDAEVVVAVADGNWIVLGQVDLRQLNELVGTRLKASHDYVTVGGYVMAHLGRIPERGDRFVEDDFRYTVLEMAERRVARIRIQVLNGTEARS